MASNTTSFSFKLDAELKEQCEALFEELGLDLPTAINVFLRQSLRAGGFPFEVCLQEPNEETAAAIHEAALIAADPQIRHYSNVEEALTALKA